MTRNGPFFVQGAVPSFMYKLIFVNSMSDLFHKSVTDKLSCPISLSNSSPPFGRIR